MSKKCPKCSYVRRPSDTAPEYECPACGVIYAKYEAYLARQKSSAAPPGKPADHQNAGTANHPSSTAQGPGNLANRGPNSTTQDPLTPKWYDNLGLVTFLLIVFWPVGLYGLIRSSRLPAWQKLLLPAGLFGLLVAAAAIVGSFHVDGNIVDLLKNRQIEAKTKGSGIQTVTVSLRRSVWHSVTVRIPAGTYFVSSKPSAQNMVVTGDYKFDLQKDWREVSLSAACANLPKDIPGSGVTFTIRAASHQKELEKLMAVLKHERVSFATRQAAVWIVTNNANYRELGKLVSGFGGFGGARVIDKKAAAQAMEICEKAGIDLTHKKIWKDRDFILEDPDQ